MSDSQKHGKVVKCLWKLADDPKLPGQNSHKFYSLFGPNGEKVWDSKVENRTQTAWRAFWCYGPDELDGNHPGGLTIKIITVVAITPHP